MATVPRRATAAFAIAAALATPLLVPNTSTADPCGGNTAGLFRPFSWFGGGLNTSTNPAQGPDQTGRGAKSQIVQWVTGPKSKQASGLAIGGTDLGIMWDNGVDGPNHQVLMLFGDTFGNCSVPGSEWRSNTMFRSQDTNLADGMDVPETAFAYSQGGSPLAADHPGFAKKMVQPLPIAVPEVTVIPTAGISVGGVQVVNFMSVAQWGAPGEWSTNYSALAVSYDNGETFTSVPRTVRANRSMGSAGPYAYAPGNENFQMGAFLKHDGFVYSYGTPQGRQGAAFVSRVTEDRILDIDSYEYWDGANWIAGKPGAAKPVMNAPVAEMSVAWNDYLKKFIALTISNGNVQMRTADKPEGPWTGPHSILDAGQLSGGFYGPFIHPWSSGPDLYYTLSLWSTYNVMLMHTRLDG